MTVFDTTWPIYSESGSCHSVTIWEIEIFKMATTNVKQITNNPNFIMLNGILFMEIQDGCQDGHQGH